MSNFIQIGNPQKPTLIIFPHAGGLATQYQNWCKGKLIESLSILIYNKPKVRDWDEFTQVIHSDLLKIETNSLTIFGHSMGALAAFTGSNLLSTKEINLILSGMNAPSTKQLNRFKELASLGTDAFMQTLSKFGGLPQEILNSPELLQQMSTHIQSDFHLLSTIQDSILKLKSPHTYSCIFGIEDKLCNIPDINSWSKLFNKSGKTKIFPGDHFYHFKQSQPVHDYLLDLIKN